MSLKMSLGFRGRFSLLHSRLAFRYLAIMEGDMEQIFFSTEDPFWLPSESAATLRLT